MVSVGDIAVALCCLFRVVPIKYLRGKYPQLPLRHGTFKERRRDSAAVHDSALRSATRHITYHAVESAQMLHTKAVKKSSS